MEYSVEAPELPGRRVTVETASGLFGAPRLLVDGVPVEKGNGGVYSVSRNDGDPVTFRFKGAGLDVIPLVEIDGKRTVRLVAPLQWYEYAWAGLPLALLLIGGAIGGLLGAGAAYTNIAIFRSRTAAGARYGLSAFVTLAAVAVYAILRQCLISLITGAASHPAAH